MLNLLLPALLAVPLAQDPTPVASEIEEVTVYRNTALVRRTATLPVDGGACVLEGLTRSLDKDNIRVRCEDGDVVSVEVRDRFEGGVPDERVQGLRDQLFELILEQRVLHDDAEVLDTLAAHLKRLLLQEEGSHGQEVASGRPSPEAWQANYDFLRSNLSENRREVRENRLAQEALSRRITDLEANLGQLQSTGGVYLYDILIDVVASGAGAPRLDVEYVVSNAGWNPRYDLRTAKDAKSVDLVYRAQVWQQSGEDWDGVTLALSTAEPKRGAQGPKPEAVWIGFYEPEPDAGVMHEWSAMGYASDSLDAIPATEAPAELAANKALAPRPFATVEDEGLSVRFRIAEIETIESRDQPTIVLVGKQALDVAPEYYSVPSMDPTVWLRGRATNTSDWELLPGPAAVFFGADFLGKAQLETVHPGEEFDLHLGQAKGISIERTLVKDKTKSPGFLSNKAKLIESWRLHLENHGAVAGTNADGSATVIVHEVLPKAQSDKISVSLEESKPKPSADARWAQDREEQGILTWVIQVPPKGETDITLETKISYPKGKDLVRK